jgi:hypothetical protein
MPGKVNAGAGSILCGAAGLALAFLVASAAAEDQPRWFSFAADGATALIYGVPDSDDIALTFRCEKDKPGMTISLHHDPIKARDGDTLAVLLDAGGAKVSLSGVGRLEQNYGTLEMELRTPFDDTMRRILTAKGAMTITIEGRAQTIPMGGAAEPAATLIAACGPLRAATAADLEVRVTNKGKLPLQSLAVREPGSIVSDSDLFGYEPLAHSKSRTFTIPDGRKICTYEIAVLFQEDDDECCSDPIPVATQDLCKDSEIIVGD